MPEIVRRSFVKTGEGWLEAEDYQRRHPEREIGRSWSSFCAFVPDGDIGAVRGHLAGVHVDVIPSLKPFGVWILGGQAYVETAVAQLGDV